jgi:hypothetical protein
MAADIPMKPHDGVLRRLSMDTASRWLPRRSSRHTAQGIATMQATKKKTQTNMCTAPIGVRPAGWADIE